MPCTPPILVAAYGNVMAGGDAFGHEVARELSQRPVDGVEVLDLSERGGSILEHLEDRMAIVIVDAAWWPGCRPGRILDRDWDAPDRPLVLSGAKVSTHGFSAAEEIEVARRLGILPPVLRLVALTIAQPKMGQVPSPLLNKQARAAAARIRKFARDLLRDTGTYP